jgi:hypothetical protein
VQAGAIILVSAPLRIALLYSYYKCSGQCRYFVSASDRGPSRPHGLYSHRDIQNPYCFGLVSETPGPAANQPIDSRLRQIQSNSIGEKLKLVAVLLPLGNLRRVCVPMRTFARMQCLPRSSNSRHRASAYLGCSWIARQPNRTGRRRRLRRGHEIARIHAEHDRQLAEDRRPMIEPIRNGDHAVIR